MKFTKMQGCGNDYVYVNGFTEKLSPEEKPEIVRSLSDRHFGIGGDGVIFINPAEEADFEMEMYNADGSQGKMCGNGIRCVGKYVYDNKLTDKTTVKVDTLSGVKTLELKLGDDGKVESVKVDMGAPILETEKVPVNTAVLKPADGETAVINQPLVVDGKSYNVTCVSMGNPHAIVYLDNDIDIKKFELEKIGPGFEKHEAFPEQVNTEFIQVVDRKNLNMRVWERGSGETLACGTGTCATVVACVLNGLTDDEVTVHLLGGDLFIKYDRENDTVWMTGPAVIAFEGTIEL